MKTDNENRIIEELTPRHEYKASKGLKDRILQEAARQASEESAQSGTSETTMRRKWNQRLFRTVTMSAAAVAVAVIGALYGTYIQPQAKAAGKMFAVSAEEFDRLRTFTMTIDVRTAPWENFASTDPRLDFVAHTLTVDNVTNRWRLEKPQRIAVNDGKNTRLWNPETTEGYIFRNDATEPIEIFAELLAPSQFLRKEKERARKNRKASYTETVEGDTVTLTAHFPAEGDFGNDYMLNSSIEESDTRRTYTFDRKTGRLLTLKIDFLHEGTTVTLAEIKSIDYNAAPAPAAYTWPDNIIWKDMTRITVSDKFVGITPEEAVRKMFAAMETWDVEILEDVCHFMNLGILERHYNGCRLMECGDHFVSGQYVGVFVPCTIEYPDGKREKLNVAIRNDNDAKAWFADGGL